MLTSLQRFGNVIQAEPFIGVTRNINNRDIDVLGCLGNPKEQTQTKKELNLNYADIIKPSPYQKKTQKIYKRLFMQHQNMQIIKEIARSTSTFALTRNS